MAEEASPSPPPAVPSRRGGGERVAAEACARLAGLWLLSSRSKSCWLQPDSVRIPSVAPPSTSAGTITGKGGRGGDGGVDDMAAAPIAQRAAVVRLPLLARLERRRLAALVVV